jgi:hypothetical protein
MALPEGGRSSLFAPQVRSRSVADLRTHSKHPQWVENGLVAVQLLIYGDGVRNTSVEVGAQ